MSYPDSHPYGSSTGHKNSNTDHSMFASQQQDIQQPLYRTPSRDPPQSWPPFDQAPLSPFHSQPFPHRSFPTPAPYTVPCSSPTPTNNTPAPNASRLSIAGSFDPATGIFCRMPEHPRLRTAQACEKCRMRKAKVRRSLHGYQYISADALFFKFLFSTISVAVNTPRAKGV